MQIYFIVFILIWIVFVIAVWVYVRKHRPEWIGLGDDFNKQKIDGVRYGICPKCSKGTLDPKFKWWQYCIGVTLPPGIMYIVGNPYSLNWVSEWI